MKHTSLRQRFMLLVIGLFLALFVSVTGVVVYQNTSTLRTNLNEQSKSFAALATKPIGNAFIIFKDSGNIRVQQQIDSFTDKDPDISGVMIVDTSGKVLFKTKNITENIIDKNVANSFEPRYLYNDRGELTRIVYPLIEDFGVHRYAVVYNVSSARIAQSVNNVIITILGVSFLIFLLAIAVTYQLMNRFFLRPVSEISEAALEISSGHFSRQITLNRQDELGDLAKALNTMATSLKNDIAKLQETDRMKTEFMTIASHNLRTPVTTIIGYLELIRSSSIPEDVSTKLITIEASAQRLSGLTEDVLIMASLEAGENALYNMEPTIIKSFLGELADNFVPVSKQKNQQFVRGLDLDQEKVLLNRPRLKNAIWNLLDNANKFTPEKGTISLKAHAEQGKIIITIADTGIGISANELPKLYTKFHRGTNLLTYNYEGTGIGLYIAKHIIESHRGTISVDSTENKGTTFTITLPIARDDKKA